MSKQDAVRAHYEQRGYATSGDAYNRDMRKARQEDDATRHYSAPDHRDPEMAAQVDDCVKSCMGCCGHDEHNPENNSSCCIIM